MANKRMFSMDIVDTDAFLDMPASSQALYFHLAMRADDDGFVGSPKKIQKICGAGDDDYKILCMKRFVIPFEKGVCVIKHWKIHNYLRKDTYKETQYREEKLLIGEKENGAYTEAVNVPSTDSQRVVNEPSHSKGKVRLDKVSNLSSSSDDGFADFWSQYPRKIGKSAAGKAWQKLKPDLTVVLSALEAQKNSDQWQRDGGKYIPHPTTWLNGKRWEDEVEVISEIIIL